MTKVYTSVGSHGRKLSSERPKSSQNHNETLISPLKNVAITVNSAEDIDEVSKLLKRVRCRHNLLRSSSVPQAVTNERRHNPAYMIRTNPCHIAVVVAFSVLRNHLR
jgi:hypothetical protein